MWVGADRGAQLASDGRSGIAVQAEGREPGQDHQHKHGNPEPSKQAPRGQWLGTARTGASSKLSESAVTAASYAANRRPQSRTRAEANASPRAPSANMVLNHRGWGQQRSRRVTLGYDFGKGASGSMTMTSEGAPVVVAPRKSAPSWLRLARSAGLGLGLMLAVLLARWSGLLQDKVALAVFALALLAVPTSQGPGKVGSPSV